MTPRSTDAPAGDGDPPAGAPGPGGVRRARLAAEAVPAGLAYGGLLCWASTALVGSFRDQDLPDRYWQPIPLRTDTSGFIAFLVAGVCLATSEYLRLRRRRVPGAGLPPDPAATLGLAAAETVAVLATGLFVYLSLNALVHPATLLLHITHLLPWPAEGTVRVEALLLCACSVTAWRYLRARYSWRPGRAQAVAGRDPRAARSRAACSRVACNPACNPACHPALAPAAYNRGP